jgi:excisionase family DNA binding protein
MPSRPTGSTPHGPELPAPAPTRYKTMLSLPWIAQRLGTSHDSVLREVRTGALPAIRVGGQYRVEQDDFAQYLADRKVVKP